MFGFFFFENGKIFILGSALFNIQKENEMENYKNNASWVSKCPLTNIVCVYF